MSTLPTRQTIEPARTSIFRRAGNVTAARPLNICLRHALVAPPSATKGGRRRAHAGSLVAVIAETSAERLWLANILCAKTVRAPSGGAPASGISPGPVSRSPDGPGLGATVAMAARAGRRRPNGGPRPMRAEDTTGVVGRRVGIYGRIEWTGGCTLLSGSAI
jgi:hypothetical protein